MLLDKAAVQRVFPHSSMREGQLECINYIIDEFNSGKQFVIVEAPTGSGKSAVGLTVARLVHSSFYVTIQKILQTQIIRDYGNDRLIDLRGRNAYPCTFYEREGQKLVARKAMELSVLKKKLAANPDCGVGYCREHEGQYKHPACVPPPNTSMPLPSGCHYAACPYYERLGRALAAPTALMNFSSFLYQTSLAHRFEPRELLIIDEAHQIEPQLMGFISVNFSDRLLRKYGFELKEFDTPEEYWVYFIDEKVMDTVGRLLSDCRDNPDPRLEDELLDLQRRLLLFMRCMKDREEWVSEFTRKKDYNTVSLKPVFVSGRARELLFKYGERVLMMSATILDTRVFCSSLGLDRMQVGAYRMKCRFPPKNRPIFFRNAGKIVGGAAKMPEWGPKLVKAVDTILSEYPRERGIIHTHNFAIADLLVAKCVHKKRFLYQKSFAGTKDQMLAAHAKSTNTIIVAPAMHEGLDLVGDLSRVQIICKVPWPNAVDDKQLARRIQLDYRYYLWLTALKLVQSYGRSVRSSSDWAHTYVLDEVFIRFLNQAAEMLPEWFTAAVDLLAAGPDLKKVAEIESDRLITLGSET